MRQTVKFARVRCGQWGKIAWHPVFERSTKWAHTKKSATCRSGARTL